MQEALDWDTCRNIENALFPSYLKAEQKTYIEKSKGNAEGNYWGEGQEPIRTMKH